MPEMTWLDATAQADLVRRGEVSPKELAEAAIARIEAVNPQLDAVIRTRFDAARLEADGNLPDGPFRGVPILFKDLGCTVAGEPTPFGVGPMREEAWAGGVADGAVSRTVRDAAGLLDAISNSIPGEPYYPPPLPGPLVREVGADPGQLRIGVLDRPGAEGYLDDPECRAAVAGAALLLEALGYHLEKSAPAAMFEPEFLRHFGTVIAAD